MEQTNLRRSTYLPDRIQAKDAAKTGIFSCLNIDNQFIISSLSSNKEFKPAGYVHLDIDRLIHSLDGHRLLIVFYKKVKDYGFSPLSSNTRLRSGYTANKLRMLAYMAELCRIVKLLQQNNIELISLKGLMLGQLYYDDYTERTCNDLDILVKPSDLEAAYQLLLKLGYTLSETLWQTPRQKTLYQKTFHHYNLYNETNDIQLELHWKLFTSIVDTTRIEDAVWKNLSVCQIGGLAIPVLSSPFNFLYLCVHGSTHQWKRLFWVLDIVRIIEKEGDDFLVKAYEIALESNIQRCVLNGCQLAHILFDVNLPQIIHNAILEDIQINKLTTSSIFFINTVTLPDSSPLSSVKSFVLSVKRVLYFYRSIYYLRGTKAFIYILNRFFVNPRYWRIYSFDDRFFVLNYFMAPLLWAYCLLSERK